jgi:hypothetical protein
MSLAGWLNQTATITRETATGLDRYNNATTAASTVASDVPCRKVEKTMRMYDQRTGEYAFMRVNLVLLPAMYVVKPRDILTIGGVAWEVQTVMNRQRANTRSHVSCTVEALNA